MIRACASIAFVSLILAACGGGGGSDATPAPSPVDVLTQRKLLRMA